MHFQSEFMSFYAWFSLATQAQELLHGGRVISNLGKTKGSIDHGVLTALAYVVMLVFAALVKTRLMESIYIKSSGILTHLRWFRLSENILYVNKQFTNIFITFYMSSGQTKPMHFFILLVHFTKFRLQTLP